MDKDNKDVIDVTKKYDAGLNRIDIFGLYYGIKNTVQLTLYDNNNNKCYQQNISVPTDTLELPNINVKAKNEIYTAKYDKMSPGWIIYSNEGSTIFDLKGNLRGYFNHDKLKLGTPVKFFDEHFEILGWSYLFRKIDMVGNILYELDFHNLTNTTDQYDIHHEFMEIPAGKYKGNYMFLASKKGTPYVEDYIIIVDMENKALVKEMDMKKIMPTDTRFVSVSIPANDWLHQNSLEYDSRDDSIIFSARHQGVVKIRMPENNGQLTWEGGDSIVWFLTPHKGITESQMPNVSSKLLYPLDKDGQPITDQLVLDGYERHQDFEWNYMQHSAILLENGNLIIYDNGDGRFFKTTDELLALDLLYSRYVEYKIDESNMTVQQIYEYGKEEGANLFSRIMSNVGVLGNNILFMFSAWQYTNTYSTYVEWEKDSKDVIYQIRSYFNGQTYRAYKINYFDYMNMDYKNIE